MVGSVQARETRRRRILRWGIGVVLLVLLFGFGWLDRTEEAGLSFGDRRRILVVSDAGPVVVSSGDENRARHVDSFLLRGPTVELATDDDEAVFRIRCDTAWPCRATTTVQVRPDVELVVISSGGTVLVSSFDGDLTIYSDHGDVNLGPVSGSARVVSGTGDVAGFGLALDRLTVDVDEATMDLEFATSPSSIVLTNERGQVDLALPDTGYEFTVITSDEAAERVDIGVEMAPSSGSSVAIRSGGPVVVEPFVETSR